MAKKPKKSGFNRHRAARVLVEATLTDDTSAARAHGVTAGSVAAWRKRLDTDPELAGLFADELSRVDGRWRGELRELVLECARKLRELVKEARALDDLRDVLDALRTAGELLISYDSLVVFDEQPADDRQGAGATPATERDRQSAPPTLQ